MPIVIPPTIPIMTVVDIAVLLSFSSFVGRVRVGDRVGDSVGDSVGVRVGDRVGDSVGGGSV